MSASPSPTHTDFFRSQRRYKRLSQILYGLLFLVVLAHIGVVVALTAFVQWIFGTNMLWYHWVGAVLAPVSVFAFGSLLEWRHLKAGGRTIAKEVGAVRLFIDTSVDGMTTSRGVGYASIGHAQNDTTQQKVRFNQWQIAVRDAKDFPPVYRRLQEFADQLAIASGMQTPHLYVLPNEQGINAFVSGWQTKDTVLVVTQGALEKLSDNALYGLIGHEYGHILHGDNRLNLKMMVMLAGLQWLYDMADSVDEGVVRQGGYFDNLTQLNASYQNPSYQNISHLSEHAAGKARFQDVEVNARKLEAQTAHLQSHNEWVAHWRQVNQQIHTAHQKNSLSNQVRFGATNSPQSYAYQTRDTGVGGLSVSMILGQSIGFIGMASAQWLKHSISRQRELLADATSQQLTRSEGIVEVLQAIDTDSIGARLRATPHVTGLSHMFFADAGTSLGESVLFASHPSISERLQAINQGVYQEHAKAVAKKAQERQAYAKKVAMQKRAGTWQMLKSETATSNDPQAGVDFQPEQDVVIEGRLQVDAFRQELIRDRLGEGLFPYRAKPHANLPPIHSGEYIDVTHLKRFNLPHAIHERLHDPLGLLSVIEAVMLCHLYEAIDPVQKFDLTQIWYGKTQSDETFASQASRQSQRILPHTLNADLLEAVAGLDRRLDGSVLAVAIARLNKHMPTRLPTDAHHLGNQHDLAVLNANKRQQKVQHMFARYEQGLYELLAQQTDARHHVTRIDPDSHSVTPTRPMKTTTLWQMGHLYAVWLAISRIRQRYESINDETEGEATSENASKEVGDEAICDIDIKIDIKIDRNINRNIDDKLNNGSDGQSIEQNLLALIYMKYGLQSLPPQTQHRFNPAHIDDPANIENSGNEGIKQDLSRFARLLDLPNEAVERFMSSDFAQGAGFTHQLKHQLSVIHSLTKQAQNMRQTKDASQVTLWLSTLHTISLYDGILSQDEYDVLCLLAELWTHERRLF